MAHRRPEQYDTLLRVRKRQEEIEALSLATAHRERRNAEAERDEFTRLQRLAIGKASDFSGRGKDSLRLNRYMQFQRHLARLSDEKDVQIAGLIQEADQCRHVLEGAIRRRRMVERLREHAWDARRERMRKEERRINDETASIKAALAQVAGRRNQGE